MAFFQTRSGILGMNARNLHYIRKFNSAGNKRFADDKLFTKQFLNSRGIGAAKLYHVVSNYQQLGDEFFAALPESFVIKPNRGFAGAGIVVIASKRKNHWISASGKKVYKEDLYRNCIEILEGKYSISGVHDKVLFEERLEPHPDFRKLSGLGLPDIRVVVFNLVPVMAMVRIPTHESDGKANMELGAIALGIDIGSGESTGGAKKTTFITRMPNGHPTKGFQIPFWEEILYTVATIQQVTKIGFLGVDIVITKEGVKVLEVNARPGLKIQVANKEPLKARLDKIKDLKVLSAEEGVDIALKLFSEKSTHSTDTTSKPIIGVIQPVLLNQPEEQKPIPLIAKIDSLAEKNYINDEYYTGNIAEVLIEGKRLKLPVEKKKIEGADLILAAKFLPDFYIDPHKKETSTATLVKDDVEERMIQNLDEKICEIDERIKLLSYINPQNLDEQKKLFLSHPDFNPLFSYRECELPFDQMRRDLKRLPEVNHLLYPLFEKKAIELQTKLDLIESVGHADFITHSEEVFGKVSHYQYQQALNFIKKHEKDLKPDESPELDLKKAKELLQEFLKKYRLSHWQLKTLESSVSDIQVTKRNAILLRKGATFQKNRLEALLVHEIGTHVFRFENGKLQNFRLFERGTANYLHTEGGIAIWNQNQLGVDLGQKFLQPAQQVVAIYLAKKMSFVDLFHFLHNSYDLEDHIAWKLCVKAKRGLSDTGKGGAFTKDTLYFFGNRDVEKFIARGGNIAELYVGKIGIEDLKIVQKLEDLHPPKFLLDA